MNPLASLRKLRKAQRLYNELIRGDTDLLVEDFPFVKLAFTPQAPAAPPPPEVLPPAPPKPLRKPAPPPKISFRARSEEDDLRDALDIGFGTLTFDPLQDEKTKSGR
jgi:hypothetical protein